MSAVYHYDWDAIRAMWEAGDSASSIAKKSGMPSKQAICNHANSQGWQRVDEIDAELDIIPFDKLSVTQCIVVKEVAKGLPQKWAAAIAGVHETTVSDWKKLPEFANALQAATGVFVRKQLGKVTGSTDWRAGMALIERHPATRGDFVPPSAGKATGQFNFNVLGQVSVGFDRDNHGLPAQRNELIAVDVGGNGDESPRVFGTGIELAP